MSILISLFNKAIRESIFYCFISKRALKESLRITTNSYFLWKVATRNSPIQQSQSYTSPQTSTAPIGSCFLTTAARCFRFHLSLDGNPTADFRHHRQVLFVLHFGDMILPHQTQSAPTSLICQIVHWNRIFTYSLPPEAGCSVGKFSFLYLLRIIRSCGATIGPTVLSANFVAQ